MATISKVQGIQDLRLMGQVADTTRPQPETAASPARPMTPGTKSSHNGAQSLEVVGSQQTDAVAVDSDQVQELAEKLQRSLDQASQDPHEVGFRHDPQTNSYVIEIKNPEGQVIKQFPPEKVLNLQQKLDELSGVVIDQMT